jgi:hypothetical protein
VAEHTIVIGEGFVADSGGSGAGGAVDFGLGLVGLGRRPGLGCGRGLRGGVRDAVKKEVQHFGLPEGGAGREQQQRQEPRNGFRERVRHVDATHFL